MKELVAQQVGFDLETLGALPANMPVNIHPDTITDGEKLMVQVSIGKETPNAQTGEKKTVWLKFSFEINKDQLSSLVGDFNFASAANLRQNDLTIV